MENELKEVGYIGDTLARLFRIYQWLIKPRHKIDKSFHYLFVASTTPRYFRISSRD